MNRFLVLIGLIFAVFVSGCASVPVKGNTIAAGYGTLVVRPVSFSGVMLEKTKDYEVGLLERVRPDHVTAFNSALESKIRKMGYFERVVFSDASLNDTDSLVLEPKITKVNAGGPWPVPAGVEMVVVVKNAAGTVLGQYGSSRTGNRPIGSFLPKIIGTLMEELGEDAAQLLPDAR